MQIYRRRTIFLQYNIILNHIINIYNGLCENVDEMILMDFSSKNEIIENNTDEYTEDSNDSIEDSNDSVEDDIVPPEPPVLV